MLCDQVLGNVDADPSRYEGKTLDPLPLSWRDCTRRAVRGRTEGGRSIGVLLPRGARLHHADVLLESGTYAVFVNVQPCDVLVADFVDGVAIACAALELGNLHVPVEVTNDLQLVTLPDGPSRAALECYAADVRHEVRRFTPLRATVSGSSVRLAESFSLSRPAAQLTKSRE